MRRRALSPPWAWVLVWLACVQFCAALCNPQEKAFLLDFYATTNAWLPPPGAQAWTPETDPCCNHWYGIVCSPNTTTCTPTATQHVLVIDLSSKYVNVHGDISEVNWSNLTYLMHIDLSLNDFTGSLSANHFIYLRQLETLHMEFNQLYGTIPATIGSLPKLSSLDLSNNGLLTGTIPDFDTNALVYLDLGYNSLSGTIPSSIAYISQLETLMLMNNELTGTIPGSLSKLSTLQNLWLSGNNLNGTIPTSLSKLLSLETLDLSLNYLWGPLPLNFADMNGLLFFNVSSNALTGTVPSQYGQMTSLVVLDVSYNQLNGTIPPALSNLVNLTHIYLNNNNFQGVIPSAFGNLGHLAVMDISINAFTGDLPAAVASLKSLKYLDISSNSLSGPLPSLGELDVYVLDMSGNKFSDYPLQFPRTRKLEYLDISDNAFSNATRALPPLWEYSRCQMKDKSPANLQYLDISNIHSHHNSLTALLDGLSTGVVGACKDFSSLKHLTAFLADGASNVPGEFPPRIFHYFSQVTYMELSDNAITGPFPNMSDVSFPTQLQTLDLSSNSLSGPLPSYFEAVLGSSLMSLYLNNNPNLTSDVPYEIPSYLEASWFAEVPSIEGHYACPRVTDVRTKRSSVSLDPNYYEWAFCNCTAGYYGRANQCQPATSLCIKTFSAIDNVDSVLGFSDCIDSSTPETNALVSMANFYPSPNTSMVTGFLPCPINTLNGATPCLPCSCTIAPDNSIACDSCQPCQTGNRGRLCSQCADRDFYEQGDGTCAPCGTKGRIKGWVMGLLALLSISISMGLAIWRVTREENAEQAEEHHDVDEDDEQEDLTISDMLSSFITTKNLRRIVKERLFCGLAPGPASLVGFSVVTTAILLTLALGNLTLPWEVELLGLVIFMSGIFLGSWIRPDRHTVERDREMRRRNLNRPQPGETSGIFKSFVNYAQISAVLIPVGIFSPTAHHSANNTGFNVLFSSLLSLINVEPVGLECLTEANFSLLGKLLLALSLPLLYGLASAVVVAIRLAVSAYQYRIWTPTGNQVRFRLDRYDLRLRAESSMLFVVNFMLFGMAFQSLQIFNCPKDPTPGSDAYFSETHPYLQCYQEEWGSLAAVSLAFIALYSMVIIVSIRRMYIFGKKQRLLEPRVMARFGFFYSQYTAELWWWDIGVLARRLLLAMAVSTISEESVFRPLSIICILLASLIAQLMERPFKTARGNFVEAFGLSASVVSYMIVVTTETYAASGVVEDGSIPHLRLAVFIVNLVVAVSYLAAAFGPYFVIWSNTTQCGMVLRKVCCIDRPEPTVDEDDDLIAANPLLWPDMNDDAPKFYGSIGSDDAPRFYGSIGDSDAPVFYGKNAGAPVSSPQPILGASSSGRVSDGKRGSADSGRRGSRAGRELVDYISDDDGGFLTSLSPRTPLRPRRGTVMSTDSRARTGTSAGFDARARSGTVVDRTGSHPGMAKELLQAWRDRVEELENRLAEAQVRSLPSSVGRRGTVRFHFEVDTPPGVSFSVGARTPATEPVIVATAAREPPESTVEAATVTAVSASPDTTPTVATLAPPSSAAALLGTPSPPSIRAAEVPPPQSQTPAETTPPVEAVEAVEAVVESPIESEPRAEAGEILVASDANDEPTPAASEEAESDK